MPLMRRSKKIAIAAGIVLILYSLIGFVIVPWILESVVPEKLSAALNRPVTINNIRVNPFSLTAAVEGLDIRDKTGDSPFVSFEELFVNIQTLSLFKLGLVATEARLVKPSVHIVRTGDTEFNFSDLIPEKKSEPKPAAQPPEAPKKPFQFSISNIAIVDGKISFQDDPVQKSHVLSAINFTLPIISNFEKNIDTFSKPLLKADLNQAGVSIDVETKPFNETLETIVHLTVSGIEIPYYFTYVPEKMRNFEISRGRMDIKAEVSFTKTGDKSQVTVSGDVGLSDLAVADRAGAPVLNLPGLQVTVAPSYPLENQLTLAQVKIESPEVFVSRTSDGAVNLTTLGPASAPAAEPTDSPATEPKPEETTSKAPFVLVIQVFILDSGKLGVTDQVPSGPDGPPVALSLEDLKIHVSEFSTAPETTAAYDIGLRINGTAPVALTGRLGLSPLFVESDFRIGDVKLAWGQPYVPKTIALTIADGKLAASGHADVRAAEDGKMLTTVSGKTAVTDFNSTDATQNEPFVSWQSFSLDGINVSTDPLKIHLDQVRLAGLKNQVILFADGKSNIQKIFSSSDTPADQTPPPKTEEKAPPKGDAPALSIGEVALENCDFTFIDRKIQPPFKTRLNLADLKIKGLTSEDFKTADLTATGAIDDTASLKIKGALNPLKKDLFLDMAVNLSNMDLSPLSPYSGTYIGQAIAKGKLTTDIAYKIDNKTISAQNTVLLDQFTLGQKVASKDALNLPVGLAIALLKDRNGQINIDLPISGRTDDPDFKYGKPLLNALQNLIVKAATSPFDLVSSMVGGGEELRYIEFDPAYTAITPAAAEKLSAIAKLIYERPGLKLDIAGYADPEADRAAMARRMLDRKLKRLYLKKDAPQDMALIDQTVIPPEDLVNAVKQAYAEALAADPEKQKTLKTADDPSITLDEMETQLRLEMTVPDAELRLLAQERSRAIKNHLLAGGSVSPDRIFLTEPKALAPEKKDKFSAARAELNVK